MKYTFLLPAFKAKYLSKALLSIKTQTYKDFRCIVSDDASPEDLMCIYDDTIADDPRFAFRRNAKNMGGKSLVSHWNMLVDMCETEYLIMASDDDVYEPTFLEEIEKLANKYPDVDVIRAKARCIKNGQVIQKDDKIPEYLSFEDLLPYFGKKPMVHCLANYVFKTSVLKATDGFPDFPKAGYSDCAAAMRLSKNGIATTNEVLFSFRLSEENLSSENGYNRYSEDGIIGCVMFADWYKQNIKPFVNYTSSINEAHYNHVVEIAQFFLCRLALPKTYKYYWQLKKRGYMNFKSTLTAIKNWVKINI